MRRAPGRLPRHLPRRGGGLGQQQPRGSAPVGAHVDLQRCFVSDLDCLAGEDRPLSADEQPVVGPRGDAELVGIDTCLLAPAVGGSRAACGPKQPGFPRAQAQEGHAGSLGAQAHDGPALWPPQKGCGRIAGSQNHGLVLQVLGRVARKGAVRIEGEEPESPRHSRSPLAQIDLGGDDRIFAVGHVQLAPCFLQEVDGPFTPIEFEARKMTRGGYAQGGRLVLKGDARLFPGAGNPVAAKRDGVAQRDGRVGPGASDPLGGGPRT